MTEQQACTLCGAGGHTAAQCNWNKADGAQGEREAFEAIHSESCDLTRDEDEPDCYKNKFVDEYWAGWKARAALAQPSPKCPTCDNTGEADSGGVMPWAEAAMLPCPDCAQPSPAPELERPDELADLLRQIEVLGCDIANCAGTNNRIGARAKIEQLQKLVSSQHDRIVGALRAEVSSWRETLRFNESCWAEERGVMVDKIQALRAGIPLAIASVEDGAVMITGIEDRLFKALSEQTHWKRKTASIELYAAPVAQAGEVPDECPHLILFDDADVKPIMFAGSGARRAALAKWEQVSINWNAHLFVRIEKNCRDDHYPCATLAAAPAQGDE